MQPNNQTNQEMPQAHREAWRQFYTYAYELAEIARTRRAQRARQGDAAQSGEQPAGVIPS